MKMWVFKIEEQWWNEVSRNDLRRASSKSFAGEDATERGGGGRAVETRSCPHFSLFIPLIKLQRPHQIITPEILFEGCKINLSQRMCVHWHIQRCGSRSDSTQATDPRSITKCFGSLTKVPGYLVARRLFKT
jgi:hypothetical protein